MVSKKAQSNKNETKLTTKNTNDSVLMIETKVEVPKLYQEEKVICIRKTTIEKIQKRCNTNKNKAIESSDILFGLATTFLGAFLSTIFSKVEFYTIHGFFGYGVFFFLFIILSIIGWICRKKKVDKEKSVIEVLEEDIFPLLDKTEEEEEKDA